MNEKQHILEVPKIGAFTFRRRVMADTFRIGAEYSRLTEGVDKPTPWLDAFATATATIKVLTVQAPETWNMDDMDPEDDASYTKIMGVFGMLRAAEARFRRGNGTAGATVGAGTGGNGDPVVSPPLPAVAERPPLF